MTVTPLADRTDEENEALLEAEQKAHDAAPMGVHQLTISLTLRGGLSATVACLSGSDARCHIWRDDEMDPATIAGHTDCSAVDWWDYDSSASLTDGYVGEDRDSLVGGRIDISSWGEDGIEWAYEPETQGEA